MAIIEVPIDSPIEAKVAWAENCFQELRDELLDDEKIAEALRSFKESIQDSHKEMIISGVADECKDCEQREGGSCCGAGLENRYNGVLLLINLLLDVKIPKKRYDPLSCFFLGKRGCRLLARHVICVNYICKKITDRIDSQKLALLREKEGVELEHLFFLHERVKKKLMS